MAKKSRPAKAAAVTSAETPRMLDHYMKQVRPQLAEALGRSNPHSIPRLEKIVVNMGVGDGTNVRSLIGGYKALAAAGWPMAK